MTVEQIIGALYEAAKQLDHPNPELPRPWAAGECRRAAEAVLDLARKMRRLESKYEQRKAVDLCDWSKRPFAR
jgi:hypothetical protein